MIKELVQFVNDVPDLVKERAVEPKVGLHILVSFDEEGNGQVVESERYLGKKHGETSQFLKDCAAKQETAWMIDSNKCLSKSKDIHSASPYCFGIKRESWIGGEFFEVNKQGKPKPTLNERIDDYFAQCCSPKFKLSDIQIQLANQLKYFVKNVLEKVLDDLNIQEELAQGDYIIVYNKVDQSDITLFHDAYTSGGLFNTSDYNTNIKGEVFGTSNFYNGFNSKKPFLMHQTASFDITSRISAADAKALSEFQIYAGKKLFPNPTPIFIDKRELTNKAVNFYHRSEDKKPTHREVVQELMKDTENLSNYYLLYFQGGAILDFDYVAKFQYLLSENTDVDGNPVTWNIENVTELNSKDKMTQPTIQLKSVFDFERVVVRELFNNALVKVDNKKGTISMRYYEDIDPKYYRAVYYTMILKYRKPIYDFIYKSMRSGIGRQQFEDICMTGILDDLRNHESNKEYAIKTKLNIYFSLFQYFDKLNKEQIMPSKIDAHKEAIALVVDGPDAHFTSDEVYAFGTGQLIYYLLNQSESGDRTHAVLEPFLQKTNHEHFNDAIAAILMKYKHAISFDFKRFNKLASEVLAYEPESRLQQLRPFLLAGYFCPNVLYTKKTETPS